MNHLNHQISGFDQPLRPLNTHLLDHIARVSQSGGVDQLTGKPSITVSTAI